MNPTIANVDMDRLLSSRLTPLLTIFSERSDVNYEIPNTFRLRIDKFPLGIQINIVAVD